MTNFKEIDVAKILNPDFIELYNQQISFFYSELVTLNSNIYILKKIQEFPFTLLCNPGDNIFFSIVQRNLYENSIIIISRIFTDIGSDVMTIPKFKKDIFKNIKSQNKTEFGIYLKSQKFDKETENLLKKSHSIRNSRLAHLIKKNILDGTIETFNLGELEELIEKFNSVLQSLSFNVERIYKPLHYSEHNRQLSDIEKILIGLASNSNILNLPEKSPEMWERYKKKAEKPNIIQINKYRKLLGLCEV